MPTDLNPNIGIRLDSLTRQRLAYVLAAKGLGISEFVRTAVQDATARELEAMAAALREVPPARMGRPPLRKTDPAPADRETCLSPTAETETT